MRNRLRGAVAALTMLVLGHPVAAQQPTANQGEGVELWAGMTATVTAPAGTVVSSYAPPLLFDGDFSSHAEQELTVEGRRAIGITGGANAFVVPFLGVQVLADWSRMAVSGQNRPYEYTLFYNSRQPPNDVLVPVKIAQLTPWPDTSGTVTSLALAFNAVARIGRQDALNVTVSAGPAYHRFSGSIFPVAYTEFQLGGHSVLFSNDYLVTMSLQPVHVWGWNVGGELNVPLRRRLALTLGYRRFEAGSANGNASAASASASNQEVDSQTLADIAAHLTAGLIRLDPSSSRVVVGVKWRVKGN